MRVPGEPDPLLAALTELSALGDDDDRITLGALRDRLGQGRLRVLVAGEAKRGKSTLVNALLGRPVLPTGVTPLTALATTVCYGQEEGAIAVFRDGRAESFPLSALDDLVTERGNPGNRRNVASVTGAIRKRLPGEAGRRRARAYLHREAASLVPQQIGRARADLQYRLAEATRQLVRAVGARYAESTFRLESALRTAATLREATADDTVRLDRALSERQEALNHVLALLQQTAAETAQARALSSSSQPPSW